jgi:hypothetical protein
MPISTREKSRVVQHRASESVSGDLMHFTPGRFGVINSIVKGARLLIGRPLYLLLGIPDAIVAIAAFYAITAIAGITPANGTSYLLQMPLFLEVTAVLLAFFVYFIAVSAPLGSFYKTSIAKARYEGVFKYITGSISILQPLSYTVLLAYIIAVAIFALLNWIPILVLIICILFYFVSINQSLFPYFLADEKGDRSKAANRGWLLLSNSKLNVVSIDLLLFSPVVALLLLFMVYPSAYLIAVAALAFVIMEGIWYCTTAIIHAAVSKGIDTYGIA